MLLVRQSAFAQGAATGDLRVSVKDPKGNVVTNAAVTVRDVAKGLERAGSSDGQGGYSVRQLAPGTYSVIISAPGFARTEATGVAITVGGMAELPVTLTVAGGKEIVEVSSEAENVETSRSSTTDTVGERRIDNLPINGRNYIQFTLTDSQVSRDSAPNLGAAPTSGLNMSGQRARSNLVNVDGADATDNSTNGVRSTVSQEAVQEFQIITNSYAAEYGRAAGGVVNIITRSGSNDFHGDVYGYLRNRNFQAVNPFSTRPNPAYTRVQAGAAFGGPIKKDKTYYYFSYEVTRRHETGFSSIGPGLPGCLQSDMLRTYSICTGRQCAVDFRPDRVPHQPDVIGGARPIPPYAAEVQQYAWSGWRLLRSWPSTAQWPHRLNRRAFPESPASRPPAQLRALLCPGLLPDVGCAGRQLPRLRRHQPLLASHRPQREQQQPPDAACQRQPQHGDRHRSQRPGPAFRPKFTTRALLNKPTGT